MLEIKAGLYHCLRILNHERHKYRPINSWCKSKKGLPCLDKLHHLNSVFEEPLEKIYDPLSEQAFLIRCMPGYTQNANEFVKALAWKKCPIHKWHGRKWIVMATVSATSHFSCGTTTKNWCHEESWNLTWQAHLEGSKMMKVSLVRNLYKPLVWTELDLWTFNCLTFVI